MAIVLPKVPQKCQGCSYDPFKQVLVCNHPSVSCHRKHGGVHVQYRKTAAPDHSDPNQVPHPGASPQPNASTTDHQAYAAQQRAGKSWLTQQASAYHQASLAAWQASMLRASQQAAMFQASQQSTIQDALGEYYRLKRETKLTSEVTVGEQIGFRVWRVQHDVDMNIPTLRSPYQGTLWPPKNPLKAPSEVADFFSPEWDTNGSGIFAYKSLGQLLLEEVQVHVRQSGYITHPSPWVVIGSVYLWGEVVVHEDGYRAEYAYPKEILGLIGPPEYASNTQTLQDKIALAYELKP